MVDTTDGGLPLVIKELPHLTEKRLVHQQLLAKLIQKTMLIQTMMSSTNN